MDLHIAIKKIGGDENWLDGLWRGGIVCIPLHLQEYLFRLDLIKSEIDPNVVYKYFMFTLSSFIYTY